MSGLPTHSRGMIDYSNPAKSQFTVADIAMGLGKACRYAGQCEGFFSVAQHSIMVSEFVPKQFAMDGLMHDGSEAFMCDLPTMLKAMLPDYKRIEKQVQAAINDYFGIAHPDHPIIHPLVKQADSLVLMLEMKAFTDRPIDMNQLRLKWDQLEEISGFEFNRDYLNLSVADQLDHQQASLAFLERFDEVSRQRQIDRQVDRLAA